MKAFFINRPMNSQVRETEIPAPEEDEILLKVMAAGVCGTDVHIFKGEYFGGYPRIPGHEFSGIVEAVGEKVAKFKTGQHVAADPNMFCEACDACKENRQNFCKDMQAVGVTRHGAFAQYLTVPECCVFDIGSLSFTEAAMIEPLACVVYGQIKAEIPLGANVLVIGAGPIGLMHAQLAALNGAASVTIVDLFVEKLKLAKKLGLDYSYTSVEFERMNQVNHFETVIDCTGIPGAIENSVKYIKDGGTMLLFGVCPSYSSITINPYEVFKRELKIVSSFALKKTFGKALALAKNKKVQLIPLVDRKMELSDAPVFFQKIKDGNPGLKAILYPNGIPDNE